MRQSLIEWIGQIIIALSCFLAILKFFSYVVALFLILIGFSIFFYGYKKRTGKN